MLIAYAWDDEPVRVLDLFDPNDREELPAIIAALTDPNVLKVAHNNPFERTAYWRQFGHYMPPEEWDDTSILAAMNGLPMSLEAAGAALNLPQQKIKEGTSLISYFCKPCKPTIANGGRTRNLPEHAPDKWERFKTYAGRDVDVMREIHRKLSRFPITDFERKVWALDARINERGVLVDTELAEAAVAVDEAFTAEHSAEMQKLTGLENPNSVAQLKTWLEAVGVSVDSLNKATVKDLRASVPDPTTRRVLELRQLLGKTSTTKYKAMLSAACDDHRVRGLLQYYGAGRTGRWAGRLVQIQNLPQNHLPDLEHARAIVRSGDYDCVEMLYEDVPDTLSQLIRTAFIPKDGCKFIVSDFSAIEARVIAWMAGESWRQEVFASGGDIYCASASQMFKVPVEKHGINGHLRQKGKIAELALGYGGSVGALKAMGALEMGLTEDELYPLVEAWRQTNPNIVSFWWDVDRAAMEAVKFRHEADTHGIHFEYKSGMLFITLPSGRKLAYVKPKIGTNKFGGQCITYEGVGGTKKWERLETYGARLVENIVQATSRDILCYAMRTLRCCSITMHIHDELVIEADPRMSLKAVCEQMGRTPPWAVGLQLNADGYETTFYKKD
jgi:DNA polymerase